MPTPRGPLRRGLPAGSSGIPPGDVRTTGSRRPTSSTAPARTAAPTRARSCGRGCPTTRTTVAARTARCWSSAGAATGLLGLMLSSQDHDPDAADEARHGRLWTDLGSGAWDCARPAERGAAGPAARPRPGHRPPGGRGARPGALRPGGRRGPAGPGVVTASGVRRAPARRAVPHPSRARTADGRIPRRRAPSSSPPSPAAHCPPAGPVSRRR